MYVRTYAPCPVGHNGMAPACCLGVLVMKVTLIMEPKITLRKKKMFLMVWKSVYVQCQCTCTSWFSGHTVVGVVYCRQEKNNIYPCNIGHVAMLLMDQRPVNNNNDFNPIHLMVYSYKACIHVHNC